MATWKLEIDTYCNRKEEKTVSRESTFSFPTCWTRTINIHNNSTTFHSINYTNYDQKFCLIEWLIVSTLNDCKLKSLINDDFFSINFHWSNTKTGNYDCSKKKLKCSIENLCHSWNSLLIYNLWNNWQKLLVIFALAMKQYFSDCSTRILQKKRVENKYCNRKHCGL